MIRTPITYNTVNLSKEKRLMNNRSFPEAFTNNSLLRSYSPKLTTMQHLLAIQSQKTIVTNAEDRRIVTSFVKRIIRFALLAMFVILFHNGVQVGRLMSIITFDSHMGPNIDSNNSTIDISLLIENWIVESRKRMYLIEITFAFVTISVLLSVITIAILFYTIRLDFNHQVIRNRMYRLSIIANYLLVVIFLIKIAIEICNLFIF
ncbi:hypothetical protein ACOME3_002294 [Neoechinorhynchus agilis]